MDLCQSLLPQKLALILVLACIYFWGFNSGQKQFFSIHVLIADRISYVRSGIGITPPLVGKRFATLRQN